MKSMNCSYVRVLRRCSRGTAVAAIALLTVWNGGAPAGATTVRASETDRNPSLTVRVETHDGVESGIVFHEDLDAVSVIGLRPDQAARIDQTLADHLVSSRHRFEALIDTWRGQTNTAPFHLSVRAIGTDATRRLVSVVFQTTVESSALAHSHSWFDAFNFDRKGRSLSLPELLRPAGVEGIAGAASPVLAQLLAQRGNLGCTSDAHSITALLVASASQPAGAHLGFTRSGALVAIDDYALGSYACGYATITLPYRAVSGSIRPRYLRPGSGS